jgi:hypothetical protein
MVEAKVTAFVAKVFQAMCECWLRKYPYHRSQICFIVYRVAAIMVALVRNDFVVNEGFPAYV